MGQGRAGGPRGPGGDKKASLGVTCCSPPGAVWVLENSPDQAVFDHYPQAPPIVWPNAGVKVAGHLQCLGTQLWVGESSGNSGFRVQCFGFRV